MATLSNSIEILRKIENFKVKFHFRYKIPKFCALNRDFAVD